MPDYKNSIKCKYCEHFDSNESLCYRLADYDSIREVSPNGRCKYFMLNDMDMMASAIIHKQDGEFPRRKDGSYIVNLHNVPELAEKYRVQEATDEEQRKLRLLCLIGGLGFACLFLLGLICG